MSRIEQAVPAARDLQAHYRAVAARLRGAAPPVARPTPIKLTPPAQWAEEKRLAERAKRKAKEERAKAAEVSAKDREQALREIDEQFRAHAAAMAAQAYFERKPTDPPTIRMVQKVVCEYYSVDRIDLLSHRRMVKTGFPRQVAIYLCRKLTFNSLPEIGRRFDGRDHSTIHHACAKIERLIETDPKIAEDVLAIQRLLTREPILDEVSAERALLLTESEAR